METNSYNGRPTNGSKTPHSNNQQSSLAELHDKDGSYHRMASNPTAVLGNADHSNISHEYDSGKQQRRMSFSHHPSSYARDAEMPVNRGAEERGSYKKMADASEHQFSLHNQ